MHGVYNSNSASVCANENNTQVENICTIFVDTNSLQRLRYKNVYW